MLSTDRFTETAAQYKKWRPGYPDAYVRWISRLARGRRCVDLGSGTGILSRQLAAAGFAVTGVEPNASMRAAAAEGGGGPTYVEGRAEATGLSAECADLVVAGQAFHWFDLDAALTEVNRILAPTGIASAVWNIRELQGFSATYDAILMRFSDEYTRVPRPEPTIARLRPRITGEVEGAFTYHQDLDLEGVLGRAWSSSYVAHGVKDRAGFDAALTDAFHRHAVGGRITMSYRTVALAWPKQAAS